MLDMLGGVWHSGCCGDGLCAVWNVYSGGTIAPVSPTEVALSNYRVCRYIRIRDTMSYPTLAAWPSL